MSRLGRFILSLWNIPRWHGRVKHLLERPSYVALIAVIAAVNAFIPFFPVEVFILLRVLTRPKEKWRMAGIGAAASVIGTVGLVWLIESQPHAGLATWLEGRLGGARWEQVTHFIHARGAVGLALVAMSILPLPPAVIVCVMSGIPTWQIALAIGIGNGLKYGLVAWLAARSPHWFRKKDQAAPSPT